MSASYCPVVLTGDQEHELHNRKVRTSRNKLYKLKSSKPHLFVNIEKLKEAPVIAAASPDNTNQKSSEFEQVSAGWLFHSERQLYLEQASQRCLWHDAAAGVYREYIFGDDLTSELTLSGVATASSSSKAPRKPSASQAGTTTAVASACGQSARHLVIMDLHKAADMFKLDLDHMDRPAAMLAVYKHVDDAMAPELAAKGLHEKLLRRYASFRSSWSDEDAQSALVESMATAAREHKAAAGIAGVVALIFGSRLVVAASHGAACAIADALPGDMKDIRVAVRSDCVNSPEVKTACVKLEAQSATCILLHTEDIVEQAARAAAAHAERSHVRAGALSLLQHLQPSVPITRSRAAACVRLAWTSDDNDEHAAKRARTEKEKVKENKVRCRQVLLRYVGCRQATDPVRRRPVSRSQAEAEAAILGVLNALEEARTTGGAAAVEAAFTQQCRAISECTSSLKGGDLAGDIGWLRIPDIKPGEKMSKDVAMRMVVIRSALALAVNEISDVIVSEEGVHLLKRAA